MIISLVSLILTILTFIAVMLVSGNNLSACIGPIVGSRIVSKRFGQTIGALGFSAGLLLQGGTMTKTVGVLLPDSNAELRAAALMVAVLVFIAADVVRVPLSLNMSLVGLLAGLSIGGKISASSIFASEVALMWFFAPLISIALSFYLVKWLKSSWPTNFWNRIQTYKVLLIILSFSSAYVLGANTLGLVAATGGFDLLTMLAAIIAIFVGAFFFSGGVMRRISQEFYLMRYVNATATLVTSTLLVEIATLFNIPLSNTQTTASAVLGTGLSYRTKFVSLKPYLTIILSWIVAPTFSFAIGIIIRVLIF